jgi:allantoate deiminase
VPSATAASVLERCDALAACSEEEGRITRRFATPALARARDAVAGWMEEAGLAARVDAVGNLVGRLDGAGEQTLLLGSHLDSVRDAGRYDGPLGVLAALAVAERFALAGRTPPCALEVVAFADEEGLRYGTAYLGSAALAGRFDGAWLSRRDGDGIALADALRNWGGDPDAIASLARDPASLRGYLEVHIEQGPVLEARDLPVGVVTAIAGQTRASVGFDGRAGHAGTTPMDRRSDALAAAAEWITAVEAAAREQPGLVATVGEIAVAPNAGNVIPGAVTASLDVRHADDAVRERAVETLRAAAGAAAGARNVRARWELVQSNAAVRCDPALASALARAVAAEGVAVERLASGAGHDGVALAALTPVAMLFVRCAGGVSHHPDEAVRGDDVDVAIDVLERTVADLA